MVTRPTGSGQAPRRPLSGDDMADLEEQFDECDADGDWRISAAQFEQLLDNLGAEIGPAKRRARFDAINTDRDGVIDRREFMNWWSSGES